MTTRRGTSGAKLASLCCLALAGSVLAAVACHDAGPTQPPPPPASKQLTAISPTSVVAGGDDLTVALTGVGFRKGGPISSQAVWRANNRATFLATTFVSTTQLTAVVPAALLRNAVNAQVYVLTRDRIEDVTMFQSNAVAFTVTPAPDGTLIEVVISQPPATIGVGETGQLLAWANGAPAGRIKPKSPIVWQSDHPTVASVAASTEADGAPGEVFWASLRGVKKGTATIRAATGGKSANVTIAVGEPATSMTISPTAGTLSAPACQSMQLATSLRDASGNPLIGRQPVWTSSNNGVVGVDPQTGVIFAGDSGTAVITATTGLISAKATISVFGHRPHHPCQDE